MKKLLSKALSLSLAVTSIIAQAQQPSLLKDFETQKQTQRIVAARVHGNKLSAILDERQGKGDEFFVSDGTINQTKALDELVTGSDGIYLSQWNTVASEDLTRELNGKRLEQLFLDGTYGTARLISVDTDNSSTEELVSIPNSYNVPRFIGQLGNLQLFTVKKSVSGNTSCELWKTDGTVSGTGLVKSVNTESECLIESIGSISSVNLFMVTTPTLGVRVWKTDGTSVGTVVVKSLGASSTQEFDRSEVSGNKAYITVRDTTEDSVQDFTRLWVSDGTSTGTVQITNITTTGTNGTLRPSLYSGIRGITPGLSGQVFFEAEFEDQDTYKKVIFKSSGSNATTSMISLSISSYDSIGVFLNNALYFTANSGNGLELHKHTEANGTVQIKDIFPGQSLDESFLYENHSDPRGMVVVNNKLVFIADDQLGGGLFVSDGSSDGTVKILGRINSEDELSVSQTLIPAQNGVFFEVFGSSSQEGVWFSDLTTNGTHPVLLGGSLNPIILPNNTGAFIITGQNEPAIYHSNRTEQGTIKLHSLALTNTLSSDPYILATANNKALVSIESSSNDGLIVTDGTTENTYNLVNSNGEQFGSYPRLAQKILVGNSEKVVIVTSSEIYISDLSQSGTTLALTASETLADNFRTAAIIENQSKVILLARFYNEETEENVSKLLSYSILTDSVEELTSFNGSSFDLSQINYNWIQGGSESVYIMISDYSYDRQELWFTDGTQSSTRKVGDETIFGNNYSSERIVIGKRIFFGSGNSTTGTELFKSDGTLASTQLLKDINPGSVSSYPHSLQNHNGQLLFYAYTNTTSGIYKSDGTSSGTTLAIPGSIQSGPSTFLYLQSSFSTIESDIIASCQKVNCGFNCEYTAGLCKANIANQTASYIADLPRVTNNPLVKAVKPNNSAEFYISVTNAPNYGDGYIAKVHNNIITPLNDLEEGQSGVDTNIDGLTAVGDNLLFTASTLKFGNELWTIVRDECTQDPAKTAPGSCGCGIADSDTDNDGTLDCSDNCPVDSNKNVGGVCGCGIPDTDLNNNSVVDCLEKSPPVVVTPTPAPLLSMPKVSAVKGKAKTFKITVGKVVKNAQNTFIIEVKKGKVFKQFAKKTTKATSIVVKLKKGTYRISYSVSGTGKSKQKSITVK